MKTTSDVSFNDLELFKWYAGPHRDPFFVYRKTPPDDVDLIEYSKSYAGGFSIKGYGMKTEWVLFDKIKFDLKRRYKIVLIRQIFKSAQWLGK